MRGRGVQQRQRSGSHGSPRTRLLPWGSCTALLLFPAGSQHAVPQVFYMDFHKLQVSLARLKLPPRPYSTFPDAPSCLQTGYKLLAANTRISKIKIKREISEPNFSPVLI